jgi:hypothetical protein
MQRNVHSVEEYISLVPEDQKDAILRLCGVINQNIPSGFSEQISYGMIGWVVPHSLYPAGYHCNPQLPLPFLNIAAQKNFIAVYHMGIYASPSLMEWFVSEYPKFSKQKLDMGKSCMRYKKPDLIPFELIGKLAQKISVNEWINLYESNFFRKK